MRSDQELQMKIRADIEEDIIFEYENSFMECQDDKKYDLQI